MNPYLSVTEPHILVQRYGGEMLTSHLDLLLLLIILGLQSPTGTVLDSKIFFKSKQVLTLEYHLLLMFYLKTKVEGNCKTYKRNESNFKSSLFQLGSNLLEPWMDKKI